MNLTIKTNRLTIPYVIGKGLIGKFVIVEVVNDAMQEQFFVQLSKTRRFFVPKEIRERMGLKPNQKICVNISPGDNEPRPEEIFQNNRFDMLSCVPLVTLSGYEVLAINKGEEIVSWYSTPGRPNELRLRRYCSEEDIARFSGYYQAECGKAKLRHRQGRNLNFTNKKMFLIEDFIDLSSKFITSAHWSACIRYNKERVSRATLDNVQNKLSDMGIPKERVKIASVERVDTYVITVYMCSSILAETVSLACHAFKEYLLGNDNENLFRQFMRGYLAGDGNFFSGRDKEGSLHSRLNFYEEKEESISSLARIMARYGFRGKTRKSKLKNLYVHTISINWENLLRLHELGLFEDIPHHRDKIVWALSQHNRYRSLRHLVYLGTSFSKGDLRLHQDSKGSWIVKRLREGLIERDVNGNYNLTEKGTRIKSLLLSTTQQNSGPVPEAVHCFSQKTS